jgi:nucleotide-binding universal stress UspA family protein
MPGTIIVGVDGSDASRAALQFAGEEAKLRGARLAAVLAWTYIPAPAVGDPGLLAMPEGDVPGLIEAQREAAEMGLERAVREAFGASPPVEIERRLLDGDPADAIVEEAASAELVVVGSRGRGDFKSALLGSVSSHVIQHAPCPVVVVKAPASG